MCDFFFFLRSLYTVFPQQLQNLTLPPARRTRPSFPAPLPTRLFLFSVIAISLSVKWYFILKAERTRALSLFPAGIDTQDVCGSPFLLEEDSFLGVTCLGKRGAAAFS